VRKQALLIAGPTASGKSALALKQAEAHDALVVNADSMQVYRDLDVLSARPPAEDLVRAPHRLYGHVDAARKYSVAAWLDDIRQVLQEADEDNRALVIVGGTGLYFRALLRGLSTVPEIPAETRNRWRDMAGDAEPGELHEALRLRDPEMAHRLEPGDTQRLTRALEVIDATGRSLLSWQREPGRALLPADTPKVVLAPPRPWLHARIDERFRQMVTAGGIEEATALASRTLDPTLPAMKAIGVRELAEVASGSSTLDEAIEASIVATRRYAKRQETFFRGQLGDWPRIDPSDRVAVAGKILP
jgi:tRNA dimethylallyltransferase